MRKRGCLPLTAGGGALTLKLMSKERPTMQDVADEAGVSCMTVSLALRNHPSLPERTRLRIQELAEKMGYRPNPLVSAFVATRRSGRKGGRSLPLAFVTSLPTADAWRSNSTYLRYFKGATERAQQLGCQLEHYWFDEASMSPERMSDILYHRGINGIIIAPIAQAGGSLSLNWERFSSVALGYSMAEPRVHRACNHQFHTMLQALRYLHELGYRRIGLATNLIDDKRVDHNWIAPYLYYTQQVMGVSPLPFLMEEAWREAAFMKWFQKTKPEVVVTTQGSVRDWLLEAGVEIPRDVGLFLLDCWEGFSGVSCVDQNSELVGSAAMDLLMGQLYRNERGIPDNPKVVLVEGALREGETVQRQDPGTLARSPVKAGEA